MVKRIRTYIALCLPALVSLVVMSCSSGMARKEMMLKDSLAKDSIMKDSITKVEYANSGFEFEGDTLTAVRIKAFEVRAMQKLKDVYDYFGIMVDSTIETQFKIQAKQMMLDMFDPSENNVEMVLNENEQPHPITIRDFADKLMTKVSTNLRFKIENIQPSTAIEKGKAYKGQLTYSQVIYRTENSKPIIIQQGVIAVNYTIKRVKKEFGSTQKEVWEVLLGDISAGGNN